MKVGIRRPSAAGVIALIALFVALTGTAYAALAKNSVGPRQLKTKAVTTAKFANDSVSGAKVAKKTLQGSDINLAQLGTVPAAERATGAGNAATVGADRFGATCPANTALIRGNCYDTSLSGPILDIRNAADACAAKGGFLPTVMEAMSIRGAINLGSGGSPNSIYTDSYVGNTEGINFGMTVVNNVEPEYAENEDPTTKAITGFYHYLCTYRLVDRD
jgi:hypothetical protein